MSVRRWFIPGAPILHMAIVSLLLLNSAAMARGQTSEEGNAKPLLYFPMPVPERAWWQSVGFTAVAPPVEITEELQVRWPAFDYHTLYGLPSGFALEGRAAVQVLQNRFAVGPRWSSAVGPISFSVGYDLAYWFGFLNVAGYDSKAHGWQGTPNVSFGYRIGDVATTVKVELLMDHSVSTYQADLEVSSNSKAASGWAFTLALEQPFYKDKYLMLGFRAMYTKFYWETWPLFSTFDRYLFYPEIIVGFIL
jgi:hypothetical protein